MTSALEVEQVNTLRSALTQAAVDAARTPAGTSWLDSHHVPIDRLLTRIARKINAGPDGRPASSGPYIVATREGTFGGYTIHDVTDAAIAYLLTPASPDGFMDVRPSDVDHDAGRTSQSIVACDEPAPVCAVSWSSRHAETLLPVLETLRERGIRCTVLDLADAPDQTFLAGRDDIPIVRMPRQLLHIQGAPEAPILRQACGDRSIRLGPYTIFLAKLADLARSVIARSTDITQPSWAAAVQIEQWLDLTLSRINPSVLICSNDTSPPGILAVRAADRRGAETVYVQHGAWIPGQEPWPAHHCRHVAVMGERDLQTAKDWPKPPGVQLHVTGQPRFDALVHADATQQRAFLHGLLREHDRSNDDPRAGTTPDQRILLWACQPTREAKLRRQAQIIAQAVHQAGPGWALVLALHPAQARTQGSELAEMISDTVPRSRPPAVVPAYVGARGCLAGADAVLSVSSTCGIEALLAGVPVLELCLADTPTLGLSDQGCAQSCSTATELAAALQVIARHPERSVVPPERRRAVCSPPGGSAQAVADIVTGALTRASASSSRGL